MCRKRGRFIPCRGGGTTTTYYTDWYDVDEDVKNVSHFGSDFSLDSWAGIHRRDFSAHTPTYTWDGVASRLIYLS